MSTPDVPVTGKVSRWEDYVDVYFSPAELFARRASSAIAPAFWTLLLLSVVVYYAFLPANEVIVRAGMAQAQAQMAEQGGNPASMEGMVRTMTYFGGVINLVTVAIMVLVTAVLLWGLSRLVEVKASFQQGLVVAVYGGFIYLLMQVAASVLALVLGEAAIVNPMRDLSFGLARFIDVGMPPGPLSGLLRRTELFLIWQAVVWGIGVYVVMKASKAQAAIVAGGTTLAFGLIGMVMALLQRAAPGAG